MEHACTHGSHLTNPSRRRLLTGLATAGAGALLGGHAFAQRAGTGARRIDFHHHFQLAEIIAMDRAPGGPAPTVPWSLSRDLEDMDQSGTATAIMTGFVPNNENVEVRRKGARILNDYMATLRRDHPGRFGSFAALPLRGFDIEGCLREIEYAAETLKVDGYQHMTSYGDGWAGDERWAPVYDELNRRRAVVHVHPQSPACCGGLTVSRTVPNEGAMIEFGTDSTRVIANLVFGGGATRWPNITWVFSHGGGVMPYIIERFFQGGASGEIVPGVITKGQDGNQRNALPGNVVLQQLRRFYYDTAQASNPVAMTALRMVVGTSQIVFGTDVWYRSTVETSRGLETAKVFAPAELHAIARGNAERLLPQFRT